MFDERRLEILQKKITGERRVRDSEDLKVMDEVFDKRTLLTLYDMLKHERIKSVEFPISTGKEGNVFMALDSKGLPLVLKIYRVRLFDTLANPLPAAGCHGWTPRWPGGCRDRIPT
jgi:serine/threonine-protein kinase RIO1